MQRAYHAPLPMPSFLEASTTTPLDLEVWLGDIRRLEDIDVIVVCRRGSAELDINDAHYTITADTLCFLPHGSHIHLRSYTSDMEISWMASSRIESHDVGRYHVGLDIFLFNNPCLLLAPNDAEGVHRFIALAEVLLKGANQHYRQEMVRHFSALFTYEIMGILEDRDLSQYTLGGRRHEYYQRFIDLVLVHAARERSVEFYARSLNITLQYLGQICRELSGDSPSEHISRQAILQIRRLLLRSPKSILQISEDLGFASSSYFVRYFRRYTGMTPNEYRRTAHHTAETLL